MARIIQTLKGKVMKEIVIPKGVEFTIGRDASNMLVIDNLAVSRFHARIQQEGWPFYIEDLKSTNGVRINGKPIIIKAALNRKDQIGIGKFVLIFLDEPSDYNGMQRNDGSTTIAVPQ